jgi:hypothetical protein
MTRHLLVLILATFCLAACSKDESLKGRWEGFSESQNWLIAVRLEMTKPGQMRASALSALVTDADLPRRHALEQELRQGMKDQWSAVPQTDIAFTGNVVTRKEGYATLFVYEPASNAMVFHFYSGGKLTEKVTLRPIETFAR